MHITRLITPQLRTSPNNKRMKRMAPTTNEIPVPAEGLEVPEDTTVDKLLETRKEEFIARVDRGILCAQCEHLITIPEELITVNNQFIHSKTNPAGKQFKIQCFVNAPGAKRSGKPTDYFSWFEGYSWQYAYCEKCGAHIGWYFSKSHTEASRGFYGLDLSCLIGDF